MLLFTPRSAGRPATLLFGNGLIGGACRRALLRKACCHIQAFPFPWEPKGASRREAVLKTLEHRLVNSRRQYVENYSSIQIVWSAGVSGFATTKKEAADELRTFRQVIAFSQRLQLGQNQQHGFHLISSAGGLFEGIKRIDQATTPQPLRPYGMLKLQQEQAVARLTPSQRVVIYRPTSVYSRVYPGKRCGLIPTLVWNSMRNRTTTVVGQFTTLRDYIWADDVGNFLANALLDQEAPVSSGPHLLATGVPTSIHHVKQHVETALMKPALVHFARASHNSENITVAQEAVPYGLRTTDVATAVRTISAAIRNDGLLNN